MTRPSSASSFQHRPKRSTHKKITIKPFSKPPKLPDNFYKETSQDLLEATKLIYEDGSNSSSSKLLSPQNSYMAVVSLVSHQYGPRLYEDLTKSMREAANCMLQPPPTPRETSSGGSISLLLLSYIQDKYQQYVDYVLLCRHVFLPLDRTHLWQADCKTAVKRTNTGSNMYGNNNNTTSNTYTLWQVGLQQFQDRMVELELDTKLQQDFWLALWDNYKAGGTDDRLLLFAKIIQMWQELQVLPAVLETLSKQLEFQLEQESLTWKSVSPYDPIRFVKHVHDKWTHVSQDWTFLPRTWLRTLVEVKLLEPHLNTTWLLEQHHLDALLKDPEQALIQVVWMLAGRLENVLPEESKKKRAVIAAICSDFRTKGLALVQPSSPEKSSAPPNNNNMVSGLLQLYGFQQVLVTKLLKGGTNELVTPLKNVWDEVMNASPVVAEQLAKHVDVQFRHGSKSKFVSSQNSSLEQYQESMLQLFCHLSAKDVFEAFYKRDLAKRLLLSKVTSMDVERNMVTLLKAECGAGYTSKMEGMFQDVEWSRETMTRYRAQQQQQQQPIDVEVQVLTTGYWPVYPQHPNLILPQELKQLQDQFHEYYKTTYQGRRMTWQYALGNVVLKASFGKKKYDLVVSLCQALVLLCFNNGDQTKWTMPEIMNATGLEDREFVERLLQSLSLGKDGTRVLRKHDYVEPGTVPAKKKIRQAVYDQDGFCVNEGFESPLRRIKINNIQWKETREEREKVVQGISRDRLYLIDAVLVRILKARKTILHQQLIPQVLEQIKVPAQPSDIKKRIESLIEREYMERDEADRNRYNYLA